MDVDPERLRRWRIDVGRLAILLAEALEFRPEPQRLTTAVGWLWRLGRHRFGGRSRDLFFAVSPEEEPSASIRDAQKHLATGEGLLIVLRDARIGSGWETSRLRVLRFTDMATWEDGKVAVDLHLIEDACASGGADGKESKGMWPRYSGRRDLARPDG